MGSELSKTVATFIVQKILLDNVGHCDQSSSNSVRPVWLLPAVPLRMKSSLLASN